MHARILNDERTWTLLHRSVLSFRGYVLISSFDLMHRAEATIIGAHQLADVRISEASNVAFHCFISLLRLCSGGPVIIILADL